jgi:capsular polysaccharide biosynthesis protein
MIANSKNNAHHDEEAKDEYVLSLGELLGVVWKWFWIVILVTFLLMGAAVGLSFLEEPEYQASIKILVGQESSDSDQSSSLGGAVQGLQDVTLTMAEAVETRSVAEEVIERLDLQMPPGDFLAQLNSEPIPNTQFIEVTYTDGNAEEAGRIANATGEVFSERVSDISPNAVTATVWDSAATPQYAANLTPLRDVLLAMVVGLMLGIGLAFVFEHLDDSWHSPEEAEQVSGVPTFGVIPAFGGSTSKKRKSLPAGGGWLDDDGRQRLMVRDEEGRWWVKLGEAEEWHYRDGGDWTQGNPPSYQEAASGATTSKLPAIPLSPEGFGNGENEARRATKFWLPLLGVFGITLLGIVLVYWVLVPYLQGEPMEASGQREPMRVEQVEPVSDEQGVREPVSDEQGVREPVSDEQGVREPGEGGFEAVLVHRATPENILANSTYIENPLTSDNPDAILIVTQNWNPGGSGGTYNDHPVGVWYDADRGQWAVFNQDVEPMAEDAAFNVAVK